MMSKKQDDLEMLDPDVRFLLANERTLLAWVRTALAVIAGGVVLTQLGPQGSATQELIAVFAILLGGSMAVVGYLRYRAADKAIRHGELPTTGKEPAVQATSVAVIAAALIVTHMFSIW